MIRFAVQPRIGVLLFLVLLAGCAPVQDYLIGVETSVRNKISAHQAWHRWDDSYDESQLNRHFAIGFRAGYENVMNGGNGCQPTLPPRCYWKPHYQTPDGRCKVAAWFDGFSHGAFAAKKDGSGAYSEIPLSPVVMQNLRVSRSRPVSQPPGMAESIWHQTPNAHVPVPHPEGSLPSEGDGVPFEIHDGSIESVPDPDVQYDEGAMSPLPYESAGP